jgi:hypothetical protein
MRADCRWAVRILMKCVAESELLLLRIALSRTAAATRAKHAPAAVTPVTFSAGRGLRGRVDELLPSPKRAPLGTCGAELDQVRVQDCGPVVVEDG